MTLDVLKQKEHGDPMLMESAFKALMCKLGKHDYFASGDEADSYKGYHGNPAHRCSFMRPMKDGSKSTSRKVAVKSDWVVTGKLRPNL